MRAVRFVRIRRTDFWLGVGVDRDVTVSFFHSDRIRLSYLLDYVFFVLHVDVLYSVSFDGLSCSLECLFGVLTVGWLHTRRSLRFTCWMALFFVTCTCSVWQNGAKTVHFERNRVFARYVVCYMICHVVYHVVYCVICRVIRYVMWYFIRYVMRDGVWYDTLCLKSYVMLYRMIRYVICHLIRYVVCYMIRCRWWYIVRYDMRYEYDTMFRIVFDM